MCYAVNAKQMSDVFDDSQYMEDFQKSFRNENEETLLSGHQTMQIDINLDLSYLTDRSATTGTVW